MATHPALVKPPGWPGLARAARDRLSGPGALRLALAAVVLEHHLTRIKLGTAAVEVFFVLSGYWITQMWDGRYRRARRPYLTYMVSRVWRLLPTFWLSVALTSLIAGSPDMLATPHQWISNIALLGYAQLKEQLVVPAWSLDLELQFYIIAPLVLLAVAQDRTRAGIVAALLVAISICGWIGFGSQTLPALLIFFALGVIAARLDWRPAPWLALGGLIAAGLGLVGLALSPWVSALLGGVHPGPLSAYNALVNLALAALLIPWAIHTTHQRSDALDRAFADLSYPLYLLHWAGVVWLAKHATGLALAPRLALTAGVCAAILAATVLVWLGWDRPINRLRARWVSGRLAPAGAGAES